jgi:hypothetical protein
MAFQGQIDKIVAKLTELTEQDKVAWEETANENTYLASVSNFVVTVGRGGSSAYAGYHFRILDNTGKIIEEALATLSAPGTRDAVHQDWDRLRVLHELARRRALQSEKVVSDLLTSLEQIR